MKQLNYGNEIPKAVEMSRFLGMPVYTINYGLQLVEDPDENNRYCWGSASLPAGCNDYDSAFNALMNTEYDANDTMLILRNHLLEPKNAEALAAVKKMREFYNYAKQIAKAFADGDITTDTDLTLPAPNKE